MHQSTIYLLAQYTAGNFIIIPKRRLIKAPALGLQVGKYRFIGSKSIGSKNIFVQYGKGFLLISNRYWRKWFSSGTLIGKTSVFIYPTDIPAYGSYHIEALIL